MTQFECHKAQIGYWIARKLWNKGIMTNAVRIITEFGFKKLKSKRISANVFLPNKASVRVLEKNNYKLERILRKYHLKDGKLIDALVFAKTK